MATITADLNKCQGYANCVVTDPDTFDLDDDGKVVLVRARIADEDVAVADEAVRSCPAAALMLDSSRS
ncbi:ferredoxin [Rhodococcus sp. IEGM 1318]|uniref:ferredoxin n=1 Tax=Rhodococcus sp. IEGM 1318 TaxID=3082226 RepID=UPI002952CE3B|nr:ferredoxin [Rhodococcus sp. IEGM 1318]MDV8009560.1 ferredoxin [Rhodococcus sp. IEGM 1318]